MCDPTHRALVLTTSAAHAGSAVRALATSPKGRSFCLSGMSRHPRRSARRLVAAPATSPKGRSIRDQAGRRHLDDPNTTREVPRWSSPERRRSSRASRCKRSRSSSACPAARSCPSTTRSSTPRSATSSSATSRAPATAAEGYAQATGRPGVAMVTSGPGATNIVTPLADAYMDSIPLVVHHRPGGDERDRHRRLPGVRHDRHHDRRDEAQLARHRRRRHPPGRPRGLPRRHDRPARARCSSTSRRTSQRDDGVVLARRRRPARLPPAPRRPTRRRSRPRSSSSPRRERPVLYAGGGDPEVRCLRGAARASSS